MASPPSDTGPGNQHTKNSRSVPVSENLKLENEDGAGGDNNDFPYVPVLENLKYENDGAGGNNKEFPISEYVPAPNTLNKLLTTYKRDDGTQPNPDSTQSNRWSKVCNLPKEARENIFVRLPFELFPLLGGLSKSLPQAAEVGLLLQKSMPHLILPPVIINDVIRRRFFSLTGQETSIHSLWVPVLSLYAMYFESLGLLLTVEVDGSMSLIDPLADFKIGLPDLFTTFVSEFKLIDVDFRVLVFKMVLSSRPDESKDTILMVIYGDLRRLAFWRLQDPETWTTIDAIQRSICDIVYGGNEQFYAIGADGTIWGISIGVGRVDCRIVLEKLPGAQVYYCYGLYLVYTIQGSLLVVIRELDRNTFLTSRFRLFKVDISKGTWEMIDRLGSMAVFIGRNSTLALDTSDPICGSVMKSDHIYFTDDFGEYQYFYFTTVDEWKIYAGSADARSGGVDCGAYDIATSSISPISPVQPLWDNVCPAVWLTQIRVPSNKEDAKKEAGTGGDQKDEKQISKVVVAPQRPPCLRRVRRWRRASRLRKANGRIVQIYEKDEGEVVVAAPRRRRKLIIEDSDDD